MISFIKKIINLIRLLLMDNYNGIYGLYYYLKIKDKLPRKLIDKEISIYTTPWYHDFECVGLNTPQFRTGGYRESQKDKQPVIFNFIDVARDYLRDGAKEITGVELFCSDGFYSNYAVIDCVDKMVAMDLEEFSGEGKIRASVLDQGRLAASLLERDKKITFIKDDVFNLKDDFDFCLCLGGLYHIDNPEKLIEIISAHVKKVLIIQSIVSLENEDEDYFESPAPGWSWGCRFSHNYLIKILEKNGWDVVKVDQSRIEWNERLCDKGSTTLLCYRE